MHKIAYIRTQIHIANVKQKMFEKKDVLNKFDYKLTESRLCISRPGLYDAEVSATAAFAEKFLRTQAYD